MPLAALIPRLTSRGRRFRTRDTFRATDAAPVTTSRRCSPGPGRIVSAQVDGQFGMGLGRLSFTEPTSAAPGNLQWQFANPDGSDRTFARASLPCLLYQCCATSGTSPLDIVTAGWWEDADTLDWSGVATLNAHGLTEQYVATDILNGDVSPFASTTLNQVVEYAIQLRSAGGAFHWARSPGGPWLLVFAHERGTTASMRAGASVLQAAGYFRNARVGYRVFADPTYLSATPSLNTNYTVPEHFFADVKITVSSLVAGNFIDLIYGRVDASNFWRIRIEGDGSNLTATRTKVVAGVATDVTTGATIGVSTGDYWITFGRSTVGAYYSHHSYHRPAVDGHPGNSLGFYDQPGALAMDAAHVVRFEKTGSVSLGPWKVYSAR